MSETEYHRGKIKEVKFNIPLEEKCKELAKGKLDCFFDSYVEYFEYGDDKYIIVEGKLYEFIEKLEFDPNDEIVNAEKNTDGTINYELSFYNGGCSFGEALEQAVGKCSDDLKE